jgi:hypothetical protein
MSNKIKLKPVPDVEPADDPSTAVTIAYVHNTSVEYSWHHSYSMLMAYDVAHHARIWRGGMVAMYGGTDGLAQARNKAITEFLADNRADWLFWVDTDMGFEADTVDKLFAVADPVERPMVGALTFAAIHEQHDDVGGYRDVFMPVVMDWAIAESGPGFAVRWNYPRDTVTRVDGTGSACILIHRSVFERIRDAAVAEREATGRDGPEWANWYSRAVNPATGELIGEDLSFCLRAARLKIPVHVDTSIQTTHAKKLWLQQQDYWQQRAFNPPPPGHDDVPLPVPAAERVAYRFGVVPTHNRADQLLALVTTLGPQVDQIIVLDNASEPPVDPDALHAAAGVPVLVMGDPEQPPNLARFWNNLFDACAHLAGEFGREQWDVAVFNDDAVVPPAWFDLCSAGLRGHEKAAVAHTGAHGPVGAPTLLDRYPYERFARMCPWAFVVKGESDLRADESMRWWFFDDDFCRQAIDTGGVLQVPGPPVLNANAVESTVGVLAEQAEKDRATFEAKWAGR